MQVIPRIGSTGLDSTCSQRLLAGLWVMMIGMALAGIPCLELLAQSSTVTMIVDGDRLVLSDGRKIKLAGIDAPEKHPSAKLMRDVIATGSSEDAIINQGIKSANYLTQLAGGWQVEVISLGETDDAGYLPAIVFVSDNVGRPLYNLNKRMLSAGYAIAYIKAESDYTSQFPSFEEQARISKKGLWGRDGIFVAPQKVTSRNTDAVSLSASCAKDAACVWVSSSGTVNTLIGMWQSRPGKICSCANR